MEAIKRMTGNPIRRSAKLKKYLGKVIEFVDTQSLICNHSTGIVSNDSSIGNLYRVKVVKEDGRMFYAFVNDIQFKTIRVLPEEEAIIWKLTNE